jgi:riboflavin biosynthesis pyrimidine reductase
MFRYPHLRENPVDSELTNRGRPGGPVAWPCMRHLEAGGTPLDELAEVLAMLDADRPSVGSGRPWVTTNMVMSLDGAFSTEGVSGGLSSGEDHELFLAQRSLADVILVGASTVRAENYRRPSVSDEAARIRATRGQDPTPRIVITSKSLSLPDDVPLLHGDPPAPMLAHPADSDLGNAPGGVELLEAGNDDVDFELLLRLLSERGAGHVVCEGGPGVLGQLAARGLIDEYMLTISPQLVGGEHVGLLAGAEAQDERFALHRVLRAGDHLMLSYRRPRADSA